MLSHLKLNTLQSDRSYENETVGKWRLNEDNGDSFVTLTTNSMLIENFTEFTCHTKLDVNKYILKADTHSTWSVLVKLC